tara:strand:- start:517 stop:2130 length:1614 start_codon:yes stop_codon:yes gene_type:complete
MATFKAQIEDLIGSVGDDALISQSLQDIGGEIISSLPDLKLIPVAKTTAISSSGLSVADKKILGVDKSDLKARFVPAVHKAKYNDTASIFAATDTDPVYYLEDEKVYVNGAAGSGATSGHLHYVPLLPTSDGSTLIAHGDSSVANFPLEAQQLLVLGSAVRCLQRLLSDKTSSLPSDISAPSLPVAPSSPSAPSFTYTDASVSDIVQPLVSVSDMAALTESAPSYVPPSLTLGAAPTISDLNIVAVAPLIPTLSSNSVTFNINAPVYTPPAVAPSFSTVDAFISTDEDVELAGAKIQEINSQIAEYQANIQNELNKFNDSNVEYQAKLQVALKDSDLSQADDSQLIQKFQSEIQLYQANVAKEVQQYQQNLEADLRVWQAERSTDLQKYSTDIQNELNSFNESNVVYQQDIQRKSQNFQKDIQVAIQNAQQEFNTRKSILDKDVQLGLQNAINNFQKEVQEYGSTLSKYQADNQKYQAEVGSTMQKYSSDVSNYGAKIQKQSIDYQWKQGQYSQLKSEYNQGLQILISGGLPQQQGA